MKNLILIALLALSANAFGQEFDFNCPPSFNLNFQTNVGQASGTIELTVISKDPYIVSLEAIPDNGSQFYRWGGDLSSNNYGELPNPTILTVTDDLDIHAFFNTELTDNNLLVTDIDYYGNHVADLQYKSSFTLENYKLLKFKNTYCYARSGNVLLFDENLNLNNVFQEGYAYPLETVANSVHGLTNLLTIPVNNTITIENNFEISIEGAQGTTTVSATTGDQLIWFTHLNSNSRDLIKGDITIIGEHAIITITEGYESYDYNPNALLGSLIQN